MRLSIQIEFDKTLELETNKDVVIVGRSHQVDLMVESATISRQHCKLEYFQGGFFITDLGSSNGTFINGKRLEINQRTSYVQNSQLTIGKLDCVLCENGAPLLVPDAKVISSKLSANGDYTSTLRLARIDLNKPKSSFEIEERPRVQQDVTRTHLIKNPISEHYKKNRPKKIDLTKVFAVVFIILITAIAWFLGQDI